MVKKLKYKFWLLTHPYVSVTPSASISTWGFERTKYGFILWTPGKKYKKCGKRIHVSWRMLID